MKLLVFLVAVACTNAQLADPFLGFIPWVQPSGAVLKAAETKTAETSVEPVASTLPITFPLLYNYPFLPTSKIVTASADNVPKVVTYTANHLPYTGNTLQYTANTLPYTANTLQYTTNTLPYTANAFPLTYSSILKHHEVDDDDDDDDRLAFLSKPLLYHGLPFSLGNHFPLAYYNPLLLAPSATPDVDTSEEQPAAVEEAAAAPVRRKRDIHIPVLKVVPDEAKFEYKTTSLDATNDPTPADTTLLQLETKTHEFSVPTFKYVHDTVPVKPITYTAPLLTTYSGYHPFGYSAFGGFPTSAVHPYSAFPYYGFPLSTVGTTAAAAA